MKWIVRALPGKCSVWFGKCFLKNKHTTTKPHASSHIRSREATVRKGSPLHPNMLSHLCGICGSDFFRQKEALDLQHVIHIPAVCYWIKGALKIILPPLLFFTEDFLFSYSHIFSFKQLEVQVFILGLTACCSKKKNPSFLF